MNWTLAIFAYDVVVYPLSNFKCNNFILHDEYQVEKGSMDGIVTS